MKGKTWAGLVAALVGVCVLVGLTLVGLGTYAWVTHVDIRDDPNPDDVSRSFDTVRQQLPDRPPLLTWTDGETPEVTALVESQSEQTPQTLHVMAWDPGDERILTVRFPFWLLRWADDGRIEFDATRGDPVTLELTVEDLERHGPGVVLDYERPGRERILVWTE